MSTLQVDSRASIRHARTRSDVSEYIVPLALVLPAAGLVLVLIVGPILFEIVLSFHQRDVYTATQTFVGIENYLRILSDPEFYAATIRGAALALSTTAIQLAFGLAMAWFVFRDARSYRSWMRSLCFLPYIVPSVSAVIAFQFLFEPGSGAATQWLLCLGGPDNWFSEGWLFGLLVLISVWQFTPFVFLVVLARLETIPKGLFEAAEADGAGPWALLGRIALPQLRETLLAVALLRSAFMFTKFDMPWLLAGSRGTNRYVETLPVYNFRLAFEQFQLGDAAAAGVLLFLVSGVFVTTFAALGSQRWGRE